MATPVVGWGATIRLAAPPPLCRGVEAVTVNTLPTPVLATVIRTVNGWPTERLAEAGWTTKLVTVSLPCGKMLTELLKTGAAVAETPAWLLSKAVAVPETEALEVVP